MQNNNNNRIESHYSMFNVSVNTKRGKWEFNYDLVSSKSDYGLQNWLAGTKLTIWGMRIICSMCVLGSMGNMISFYKIDMRPNAWFCLPMNNKLTSVIPSLKRFINK